MKIGIVGLGLIGGSLAKALKYNTAHTVLGWNRNQDTLLKAKLLGAVDGELTDEEIPQCDMLICALYPKLTVEFVQKYAPVLKKGAIVIDCCGVKRFANRCGKLRHNTVLNSTAGTRWRVCISRAFRIRMYLCSKTRRWYSSPRKMRTSTIWRA